MDSWHVWGNILWEVFTVDKISPAQVSSGPGTGSHPLEDFSHKTLYDIWKQTGKTDV